MALHSCNHLVNLYQQVGFCCTPPPKVDHEADKVDWHTAASSAAAALCRLYVTPASRNQPPLPVPPCLLLAMWPIAWNSIAIREQFSIAYPTRTFRLSSETWDWLSQWNATVEAHTPLLAVHDDEIPRCLDRSLEFVTRSWMNPMRVLLRTGYFNASHSLLDDCSPSCFDFLTKAGQWLHRLTLATPFCVCTRHGRRGFRYLRLCGQRWLLQRRDLATGVARI